MNPIDDTTTDLERILRERVDHGYSHGLVVGLLSAAAGIRFELDDRGRVTATVLDGGAAQIRFTKTR